MKVLKLKMTETINRYDRQERIEGWDQSKLTNASIAIVGSGHVVNYLLSDLAGLGVGDLRVYDDERIDHQITGRPYRKREFLLSQAREKSSKVEILEQRVQEINPNIFVAGIHMGYDGKSKRLIKTPDRLIIATNSKEMRNKYKRFATDRDIPVYVVHGNGKKGFFTRHEKYSRYPDYSDSEQEGIVAEVISGLLAGEIVQDLIYGNPVQSLSYCPTGQRFRERARSVNPVNLRDKRALVIGAGALGNFLCLGLTHTDIGRVYLVDNDIIEPTNLNRQIMFYGAIGEHKAEVLAQRTSEINPNTIFEPILERVNEDFEERIRQIKPDVIIDCVDNLGTRAILNHFAVRYGIPLISGGTDPNAGQVVVYEPGKTSCLDCKLNVDRALVQERRAMSCMHAPTPSVIITNHIIGGLMAAETRCVLDPKNYGEAVRRTIKYDSTNTARIGLIGTGDPCACKREDDVKIWMEELMKAA